MENEQAELKLYAENLSKLYAQRKSIELNLLKKLYKNKFDIKLSVKLWTYWIDEATRQYNKEHGNGSLSLVGIFSKDDRLKVAERMAEEFLEHFQDGQFDGVEVFKGKFL